MTGENGRQSKQDATENVETGSPTMGEGTGTTPTAGWAEKRIFTTGEAADVCKVSQQTIIRCFDSGRLGGFRVPGSKFRRIPRADLIKFMRENEIPVDVLDPKTAKRVTIHRFWKCLRICWAKIRDSRCGRVGPGMRRGC